MEALSVVGAAAGAADFTARQLRGLSRRRRVVVDRFRTEGVQNNAPKIENTEDTSRYVRYLESAELCGYENYALCSGLREHLNRITGDEPLKLGAFVVDFDEAGEKQPIYQKRVNRRPSAASWTELDTQELQECILRSPGDQVKVRAVVLDFRYDKKEADTDSIYRSSRRTSVQSRGDSISGDEFNYYLPRNLIGFLGTQLCLEPQFFLFNTSERIQKHMLFNTKFLRLQLHLGFRRPTVSVKVCRNFEVNGNGRLDIALIFFARPMEFNDFKGSLIPCTPFSPASQPNSFTDECMRWLECLQKKQVQKENFTIEDYVSAVFRQYQTYMGGVLDKARSWIDVDAPDRTLSNRVRWDRYRSSLDAFKLAAGDFENYAAHLSLTACSSAKADPVNTFDRESCSTFAVNMISKELINIGQGIEASLLQSLQLEVSEESLKASGLSLEESRKSIAQAKNVGRLTFLGFVFIPLSLVTSVFGMNVYEIAGTGPHLRWFFITAASLTASTLLMWLVTVRVSSYVNRQVQIKYDGPDPHWSLRVIFAMKAIFVALPRKIIRGLGSLLWLVPVCLVACVHACFSGGRQVAEESQTANVEMTGTEAQNRPVSIRSTRSASCRHSDEASNEPSDNAV